MNDRSQSDQPHHDDEMPPTTLLDATIRLTYQTRKLRDRLDISDRIARRTRLLSICGVIALVVITGFGAKQFDRVSTALERANAAIDGNQSNAIATCENANESRAANLALWTKVLDYVQADGEDPSITKLQVWIAVLYQPHDCTDLDREYNIPPSPDLG